MVACFTGNIRPVKGVNYLLDAFSSMSARDNIHLLVIGDVRDKKIKERIDPMPSGDAPGAVPPKVRLRERQ